MLAVPWYQAIGIAFLLAIATYIASGVYSLYRNYQQARYLGLHIVISPVQPLNLLWAFSAPILLPLLQDHLPFGLDYYFNYAIIDWPYYDRYRSHEKWGDAFVVVNPRWISLVVSDAAAIDEIMARRKDFTKPQDFYSSMEVFGPNVDTVEGLTWQRHRKITTPPFNERNSSLVWKESLRQAGEMQSSWAESKLYEKEGMTSICADTLTLALHVLTGAGFGQQYSFKSGTQTLTDGHKMSYRDALCEILRNLVPVIAFNHDLLNYTVMPASLRKIGLAIKEFRSYMREMIDNERTLIDTRDADSANLIGSLIRSSEEGKATRESLSDDEIMGNLFIYNLAGHETTANTLAYAITLLSINSELQDWLHEELVHVLGADSQPQEWVYEDIFGQLKRTLAVMLETLRLYPPVVSLSKENTTGSFSPLTIAGKEYQVRPGIFVVTNTMAAHTLPKYWGKDSLDWKPKRWIEPSPTPTPAGITETISDPPVKGCYKPWGEGPRVCPGKKFAQVEFVAVMAALFRDWRVRPRLLEGESAEGVRERVLDVVEDSQVTITLQMKRSESVALVWSRR